MEEAHIVLVEENEIVVVPDLKKSISRKLDTLGQPNETHNSTIFRVPYRFRQSKENLFEPPAVSFGPFHHGNTRVQAEEEQKLQFLRDFLSRGDHTTLDLCLSEIKKLEERTRRCYSESVPLDSNSFVEMMLLDGCFVLEYFLKLFERRYNSLGHSVFVLSDFLVVENQIPFFIVEKLYEIGKKPEVISRGFTNFIAKFLAESAGLLYIGSIFPNPPDEIHHLVHLCYLSLIPNYPDIRVVSGSDSFFPSMLSRIKNLLHDFPLWVLTRIFPKRNEFLGSSFLKSTLIPCATEIQNAGIKLRAKSNPRHMLDVSFKHRVLEIPTLIITNESKTLLANLVAFEQYKFDEMRANLSNFALFLDSLVNTPEDLKILQQCGIIYNCRDTDEELTVFFNQICKGIVEEENDHFLAELFTTVNEYCESKWARWNRHKTQFIDTYFRSPWTAISVVAAGLVVLLTCLQSFYAVYAYYVPPR